MRLLLTTSALALCLATSAFASSPLVDDHSTHNDPVAIAGAAAGAEANAGAAALSGSVSGANAVNTAITGPSTATNTSVNSINGGDNRATVGNVTSSSGPSTSSASGGRSDASSTLIAPVTTTDTNVNGQQQGQIANSDQDQRQSSSTSTSTNQSQALSDSSVHTQSTTASTGASTSSASGNGAGQTTTFTQNYEAADIPKPSVNTAYAAPSVVGGGVCAYTPFSAGLSLRIVSGSASGAIIDKGCESRANADVLARLGYTAQAVALLMQNEAVAQAFRTVGDAPAKTAELGFPKPVEQASNTLLPTMPSDPVKGTMLPIPDSPKKPRGL